MSKPLTGPQMELLRILPDAPSDGRFLKGARRRTAENLVRLGFARCVGKGWFNGASFVRTPAGAALPMLPFEKGQRVRWLDPGARVAHVVESHENGQLVFACGDRPPTYDRFELATEQWPLHPRCEQALKERA